jgi:tRNA pseudouridine38-40 synthase
MRFFLHIAYNGYNYRGWQRQVSAVSVQECLEDSLSLIFKQKITCIGCGRTDAMVHASQFFVHFDIEHSFEFDLIYRLEKSLPHDIVVFDVFQMKNGTEHTRFDALERSYTYFVHTDKDPFLHTLSAYYEYTQLNFDIMKKASQLLLKYTEYSAFCYTPDRHNTTICTITDVQIFSNINRNRIKFHISANRFLKGMIRIIIGKLLEVGAGRLSLTDFEDLLISKKREKRLNPAYPQGLYLSKVIYPYLNISTKSEFWNIFNEIEWVEM